MEIRDYRTGDENKILELFEMVFKQKMTMSYWKWRFEDNPAGKHLIKLMWDNEILIGHYAVSPVWLNIENTKMLSALSMTTMTHPDYGGLGVFGSLSNALYKKLEEELDVKAIWGFPNNNSHYGFIKNLKWNDLGQISHLALPSSKLTGSLNDNIAMFTHFGVEHGNLISKVTSQFKVAVLRDKLYLNWRYVQNPSVPYDKFEYRQNGSLLGFVVLKKYPSKIKPDVFDLFITEIGIEKENFTIISVLISHIAAYYNQTEAILHTWISLFDQRYILLEKLGFIPSSKPTFIGVRPHSEMMNVLTDYRNWYISYGDSDVY